MTIITLTQLEARVARGVARVRFDSEPARGNSRRAVEDGLAAMQQGYVAEMAVAKHLGIYWPALAGDFVEPDFPFYGIDVRSTAPGRQLVAHPWDADHWRLLLVYVPEGFVHGELALAGWQYAKHAKRGEWHEEWPVPGWTTPRQDLLPMATFRKEAS